MPNSEYSKLKLLYLYHYFRTHVDSETIDGGATMGSMLAYLNEKTGAEFERKSVYSDIARLNQFARSMGFCDEADDWITLEGKMYYRGQIQGDLTSDEAKLLVDAINASDFVDSGLTEKIKALYPAYFKKEYNSIVPHDGKMGHKTMMMINIIRSAIDDNLELSFEYGYQVASGIRGATLKNVSPLGLDFKNSHYYLYAIDNEYVKEGAKPRDAIKSYRLDRMRRVTLGSAKKYVTMKGDKDEILKSYAKDSIGAYTYKNNEDRFIQITLRSNDTKMLLKAYSEISEKLKTKLISDKFDSGEVKFGVTAALVPTFFQELFLVSMYKDVTMTIDDEEVKKKFREHLTKAESECR